MDIRGTHFSKMFSKFSSQPQNHFIYMQNGKLLSLKPQNFEKIQWGGLNRAPKSIKNEKNGPKSKLRSIAGGSKIHF